LSTAQAACYRSDRGGANGGGGGVHIYGVEDTTARQQDGSNAAVTLEQLEEMAKDGNADLFLDTVATACRGRALFTTDSGMIGIGPKATKAGEFIYVIFGTVMPFIIRSIDGKYGYGLRGESYIDDIICGEIVGTLEKGKRGI
jgi:hypothetical protein